jgi:hypothetical protein
MIEASEFEYRRITFEKQYKHNSDFADNRTKEGRVCL